MNSRKLSPLNLLLENLDAGLIYLDTDQCIQYYNPVAKAWATHFHLINIEKGQKILHGASEKIKKRFDEIFALVFNGEEVREVHEIVNNDWDIIWLEAHYTPIVQDHKVIGMGIIIMDITEHILSEEENRLLSDEMEKRVEQRTRELQFVNKQLDTFNSTVAHDLRAPIRGLRMFADLLNKKFGDQLGDKGKEYIDYINQSAKQIDSLVKDLLAYSRARKKELVKVKLDMNQLVNEVFNELKPNAADRKIELIIDSLEPCRGDRTAIKQVLSNLIGNAIKFTAKESSARIIMSCEKGQDEILFFIKDNGIGFKPEFKEEIFKIFRRLNKDEDFEGTGIGLAIVEQIIERHGGQVWANSEASKGATFYFTLPL